MLDSAPREIAASGAGQRQRRRHERPAPGTPQTRRRDALIVSLLAYAGLRPGELRALRWQDVQERTLLVQRAAAPDGNANATKTGQRRSVRLLAPLAAELREYRLAAGRPPEHELLMPGADGGSWVKSRWQAWRRDHWMPVCRATALDPTPRPYDLRHSFASLLLSEGRQPTCVARQLGHSLTMLLETYAHLIDEFDGERVDAEAEIEAARKACFRSVPASASG